MKSIIQEASSIQKAIDQAWIKAGKPKEFSIRLLEEPIKNFFGFTTKMAKIALFFGEMRRDGGNRPAGQHRYRRRHHRRPHYQDQHRQDAHGQPRPHQQQQQRSQHPHNPSNPSAQDTRVHHDNNSNDGSSES